MDDRDANNQQQQSQLPDVFALERLCVAWGLTKDPAIQVALASLKANPLDPEAFEFVTSTLDDFRQVQNMAPDPFAASAPTRFDDVDGQLVLGMTSNGTIYGINPDALCRHLLLAGSSGTGKTATLRLLLILLVSQNPQMGLIVLAEKRNFRFVLRHSEHSVVIPWELLRDNILRNPRLVSLKHWGNQASMLVSDLDLRVASQTFIRERMDELYEEFGFTGEYWQPCPVLRDLHSKIRSNKLPLLSNLSRYKESSDNRISGILHYAGDVFDCNRGLSPETLQNRPVIIELDGTTPHIKDLLLKLILSRILLHRINVGERTSALKTLIVVDEAQGIFRRQDELSDAPSNLGMLIALAREFGCGIVAGVQNIRDVSYALVSNCAHKIGTGFSDMRDLEELCRVYGMNRSQGEHLARTLGPGRAIVQDPRYPDPFVISIPFVPLDSRVSDEEVLDRYEMTVPALFPDEDDRCRILDAIRRRRGRLAPAAAMLPRNPMVSQDSKQRSPSQESEADRRSEDPKTGTQPAGSPFLHPVAIQLHKPHPFLTEAEIFSSAGITSGSTRAATKRWLIVHGFIREYKIQRKKSFLSVWEPLEKAYVQLGLVKPQYASKGGYLHQFAAHWIKSHLIKQGYDVTLEYTLPDLAKAVDLWAKRDDETIAWEIAISPPMSKEIENLVKDLSSATKPDRIVVATIDSKMRRELETLIARELWLSDYRTVISLALIGDCIA